MQIQESSAIHGTWRANDVKLYCVVSYADVKTLRILSKVRWMITDVRKLVNSVSINENTWTARRIINSRRLEQVAEISEAFEDNGDSDTEQVFLAFTTLFRKMVDDHYSSLQDHNDIEGPLESQTALLAGNSPGLKATAGEYSTMALEQSATESPKTETNDSCEKDVGNVTTLITREPESRHRLPLWSTTTCGQRGKLKSNTSTSLTIWNPPFHLDWAAIDSLVLAGITDGYSDRYLQSVHSSVIHM